MPELPEVQTVVNDLNEKIKGKTITGFWSDWKKIVKEPAFNIYKKEIIGRKIIKVWRLGKNIFINLSGGKTLYIHLKMTGHLLVKSQTSNAKLLKVNYFNEKVNQYIHNKWYLDDNMTLEFSDVRKFGKIILIDADKIKELKGIKELGIDLMSSDFKLEKFKEILSKRKSKAIGLVLMEQELLAGIGNIYRSEILFEAKISPLRLVGQIKERETEILYKAIIKILKEAIKLRGTSDSDYRDTSGAPGGFQKVLKVYRRDGQKCFGCPGEVKRLKIGGRTAFYCEKCQK